MVDVQNIQRPSHVPEDIVRNYAVENQPGVEVDPYRANQKVFELPPIYWSPVEGGAHAGIGHWVISKAEYIREVYGDPSRFSSNNATGFLRLVGRDQNMIPIELDPPEHTKYRMILNPRFTPARMAAMDDAIRQRAREMLEPLRAQRGCEFEAAFGRPFPVSIFLDLMSLPQDRILEFIAWEQQLLHGATLDDVRQGADNMMRYLEEIVAERRQNLGDDLPSYIIQSQVDGRPLTNDEIMSMCFLLFFGGLDTVASTLNFIFKYLGEYPEQQQLLREEPDLIPNAVEEFLRAFSVVPSPRVVAQDFEFHGVQMRKGDRVILNVMMSGRDPSEYENPNVIDIRRKNPRHMAFATGVHTCLGLHLARRELRIAIEEWLQMMPPFRTDPKDPPTTHARAVWGVKRLPLIW